MKLLSESMQILSGHGCFGRYLHKIAGREPTEECHECGAAVDTAQHTLEDCPVWGPERADLIAIVGPDLSLPAVVKSMVDSERSWQAMQIFCEEVMQQKEMAERAREIAPMADQRRRKRARRRRVAHDRRLPP
ncbi:uncharacterized protein LOC125235758 [Leguminivora glycinivorella]|uniref:uncharacterized protein LOC125235758 n=1 Tax=Leguminivora glycinivorella TaxID=1035111 RepID=UPI00200F9D3C|nr:uncharacterized protein LOC125235758 [Leguminivora glycinivorella]